MRAILSFAVALSVVACTCQPGTPTQDVDAGGGGEVDRCANVTCVTPPGQCYQVPGGCDAGVCVYAAAEGAPCDDGESCTTGDVCQGTTCVGAPVVCADVPPLTCLGGSRHRVFDAGVCVAGACTYPSTEVACADGVCGARDCGGTCVDVSADPNHCGACGHRCRAGGCSGGVCFLFPLVRAEVHPWLAVDESGLYWSAIADGGGTIRRLPFDGGASEVVTTLSDLRPWQLAVGGSSVFFVAFGSDGGAVLRVDKGGGPAEVLALERTPTGLAVDDTSVYWSACPSSLSDPQLRRVASVPRGGGTVAVYANTTLCPQRVAADGEAVYWSEAGLDGGLHRVPLDGGAPMRLAVTNDALLQSPNDRLAANASRLWSLANGGLRSVSKGGGVLEPVGTAAAFAVDEANVYWLSDFLTPGVLTLWKRPLDGGADVQGPSIAGTSTLSSCTGFAMDSSSLYAACVSGGQYQLVQLPR
ncbi:MAG: hypothetical protein AB1938_22420 [Myxococcota bacterium]